MTFAKRCFDVIIASFALVLTLPAMIVIAVLIKRDDGGPVFFLSERMKDVHTGFTLVKFRTMRHGPRREGVTGGDKAADVTKVGGKLRASRLDELPQLWNVLRGDISLVGPRPPLRRYVESAPELYREVLVCRPGITGLATLKYHRHESNLLEICTSAAETEAVYRRRCVPQKARIDIIYRENRNICFDLVILAQTFCAVLFKHRRNDTSSMNKAKSREMC